MLDKSKILQLIVLAIILSFGFYLYIIYQHKQELQQNVVSEEIIKQVNEGLPNKIDISINKEKEVIDRESVKDIINGSAKEYNEEKLFEILDTEQKPNFLDNLMTDLVIKNNSTTTIEETCSGKNLLENDECKQSLFIGCSEALYLKFALVNECTQFAKQDYVNYLKAKQTLIQNSGRKYFKAKPIMTEVGEVIPSEFILTKEELRDTIDSSILNNDFTKNEENINLVNDSQTVTENEVLSLANEADTEKEGSKKVLSGLIGNLTGAIASYTGWIQGWATIFAVNNGRHEAGFKMYKTTAFGYNPYLRNTCLISLPYKTVDKFFGTNLNYCVKNKNVECILNEKKKVKGIPIEVLMIKNNLSGKFILGDLGPAEWTGNAIDLNKCVADKLGATGKDQVRFRVAK